LFVNHSTAAKELKNKRNYIETAYKCTRVYIEFG